MTKNADEISKSQPELENIKKACDDEETEPCQKQEITVPIKFNKEVKNLKLSEAANLAQKGMKYDCISKDYDRIRELAKGAGVNVEEFIDGLEQQNTQKKHNEILEKYPEREELAKRVLELEGATLHKADDDFLEIKKSFPEIESVDALPSEVTEKAKLKGTKLLDEYLRYLLEAENEKKQIARAQKQGESASVGSQGSMTAKDSAVGEFLKGLWG